MNLGAAFWGICPLVAADVPLPFPGFFIFSLQPQTVNCHAPQTVTMRMRNKRRNAPGHVVNGAGGGGAPPPTHTEPPMARIPGRGRLPTMGASSPLEYCSLKQEIAKKNSLRKGEPDVSHGTDDIVSIWGLITIEAADMCQILS